jgi:octaprenyl-diphosphate synthase
MPLIYAMQKSSATDKKMIRNAILEGGLEYLEEIQAVIKSTGALQYTAMRAQEAADDAITALADIPESDYKQALIAIADYSVQRRS